MARKFALDMISQMAARVVLDARAVYWFNGTVNFGDLLMPALMSHFGYRPLHCSARRATIVGLGSVVHFLPENFSGVVLGSGLIRDQEHPLPKADIRAVRGPLTRNRVGASDDVVLGDPGLLANRLLDRRSVKSYTLGLVPHYVDKQSQLVTQLKSRYTNQVSVIDVQQDPVSVISEIDECENIISSSLHGLIVADSLGIPANWIRLSDRVVGGGFKFRDYNESVGASSSPATFSVDLDKLLRCVRRPTKDLEGMAASLERLFCGL